MAEEFYKCCFTGYRPDKFPFALNEQNKEYIEFENQLFEQILQLAAEGVKTFYCGMAMGFDLLAAKAVLLVKDAFESPLELICVLPFAGQGKGFPEPWNTWFSEATQKADQVIVLSEKYTKGCYQQRNIYMVDKSDFVVTWYDGKKGGTANTLNYARKKGRQIFNINKVSPLQTKFEI